MNKQDIDDIKTVLNEQFDLIQRFGKMPVSSLENWKEYQTIYLHILECNKVMMEIVNGPSGKVERMIMSSDKPDLIKDIKERYESVKKQARELWLDGEGNDNDFYYFQCGFVAGMNYKLYKDFLDANQEK